MNTEEKQKSSQYIYKGAIINLRLDDAVLPNGKTAKREVIEHPGGVGVLPIDKNGDCLLVRQFRYPYMEETLEIPAGKRDKDGDSDPLACGKRELKEETGLSFKNWKLISAEQRESKEDRIIYTFVATDFESETEQSLDQGGEEIEVLEVTLEELKAMKGRPDAKHLHLERFDEINSIKDLQNLPSLV